jgi:hypothetical protein
MSSVITMANTPSLKASSLFFVMPNAQAAFANR